jgi:hypothetical protein
MKQLPQRPNVDRLKRQAKDLLILYRSRDVTAIARFRSALPLQPATMIRQSRSSDFAFTMPNRAWLVSTVFRPGRISKASSRCPTHSQLASPTRFSIGCVSSMQGTLPEEPIVQDRWWLHAFSRKIPVSSVTIPMLHARPDTSASYAKQPRRAERGSILRVAPSISRRWLQ